MIVSKESTDTAAVTDAHIFNIFAQNAAESDRRFLNEVLVFMFWTFIQNAMTGFDHIYARCNSKQLMRYSLRLNRSWK